MFYTSAITSLLPYILFLGIMCTYYLGITNNNDTENASTAHLTNSVSLTQKVQDYEHIGQSEHTFHYHSCKIEKNKPHIHLIILNEAAFIPCYNFTPLRERVAKFLFSRPPPFNQFKILL